MKGLNIVLWIVILLSAHGIGAVNITGKVIKSDGTGIKGVKVRLGKAALTTESGDDGKFTLKDNTEIIARKGKNSISGTFLGKHFFLKTSQASAVEAKVYDCKGRMTVCKVEKSWEGIFTIKIPYISEGVYLWCISTGTEQYIFRHIGGIKSTDKDAGIAVATNSAPFFGRKASTQIDDALLFIKEGYRLSRIEIKNPDTSGLQVTMLPLDTGTMTDVEGNVYRTVKIGNQVWMAENLRTTKYNDGSSIGSGCHFYTNVNDAAAKKKWGALYSQSAAKSGKLAPKGWRLPTNADWDTLKNYLITHGYNYDGTTSGNKIAKALAATTDWEPSSETGAIGNDLSLNNSSGFSALPAGWRYWGTNQFEQMKFRTYWWSATQQDATYTCVRDLWYINFDLDATYYTLVECSVRLVKDN